jgi:hypothetical protein
MDALAGAVAFFDIGNTLASVVVAPSGDRIERLAVFPDVPSVLGGLSDRGVRLGIISDRGRGIVPPLLMPRRCSGRRELSLPDVACVRPRRLRCGLSPISRPLGGRK